MVRIDITALLCICLPLILGAPVDEVLKQQIASRLFRNGNEDSPYWSMLNPEYSNDEQQGYSGPGVYGIRTRGAGLDSLGHGNLLRSLSGMGSEWGDQKSNGWRFGVAGSGSNQAPKRGGGGLDSLGRGNILRRVNYDEEIANFIHSLNSAAAGNNGNFLRSLDSLGKGNILKRSVHDSTPESEQQHSSSSSKTGSTGKNSDD